MSTYTPANPPKRWGPSRVLQLADLDPITREIVVAILCARRNAAAGPA